MAHPNPNFYDAIVAGISSSQDHWANGSLTSSYVTYIADVIYGSISPSTSTNLEAESGLLQSIVSGIFATNHIIPSELADYSSIATAVNDLFQQLRTSLDPLGSAGIASALQTTSTPVDVAAAAPPEAGQVLTATSATEATWQDAATGTTFVTLAVDINLTTTGNNVIDTRPASPPGPGRWKLVSIDLRVKVAITGGGSPSSIISIGSTSGGQQIVINQTILPAATVGSIVGGFALGTLGSDMTQVTGFEAMYSASQEIWANVTASGPPATGTITAYLVWQGLP